MPTTPRPGREGARGSPGVTSLARSCCACQRKGAIIHEPPEERAVTESASSASATDRTTGRRLVHVQAADLDRWGCRPFQTIDILDLQDRPNGQLEGIVIDCRENRPVYLVVARGALLLTSRRTDSSCPLATHGSTRRPGRFATTCGHTNASHSIPTSSSA
jgi:hypothetical protein